MLENYYRELVCFLNAKLGNRQVAEDVVHDAYVRVLERSSDTPIEQPRAFLYRTALNLVIDGHRRNALRQVEPLDVLDSEERFATCSPHPHHDHGQRLELLERALAELPLTCRKVFIWQKLEGLTQAEIAERMGLTKNMVEKYMIRTLRHLREHLDVSTR